MNGNSQTGGGHRLAFCLIAGCGLLAASCLSTRGPESRPGPIRPAAERNEDSAAAPARSNETGIPATLPGTAGGPRSPLTLTVQAAVLLALENNAGFKIDRLRPAISRIEERVRRADFDPVLSVAASSARAREETGTGGETETTDSDALSTAARVTERLPTGTTLDAGVSRETAPGSPDTGASETTATAWDVTITQALLRGRGTGVNLAALRQARMDTRISNFELRGAAESLVAQVERTYWDYVLDQRSMEIFEKSVQIAERAVEEVRERIAVGKIAGTELAAAEAEAAGRREQLIDARGTLDKRRLNLIRLLNPTDNASVWDTVVELTDDPAMPAVEMDDVDTHVMLALMQRPDLNQARLRVEKGDIEIVRTRNGTLPRLDFFIQLGKSSYAYSFEDAPDEDSGDFGFAAGANFELPLGNREAKAIHERAKLSREQAEAALRNMEQLVQVDVRSAYVDVLRMRERVKATASTRALREKTLANEDEKLLVGKSTTFLVSQARRDLVASQIAEVEAITGLRKALLELFRLEGSLLERTGIKPE